MASVDTVEELGYEPHYTGSMLEVHEAHRASVGFLGEDRVDGWRRWSE